MTVAGLVVYVVAYIPPGHTSGTFYNSMDAILYRREPSLWDHLFDPLLFLGTKLYRFTTHPNLKPSHTSIRIVCLSDTHNDHASADPLPHGDILIHAGDLTQSGTKRELFSALSWLHDQPHTIKLFIAGNHDLALNDPELVKEVHATYPGLIYLQDSSTKIIVRGQELTVFGSPQTPRCGSWPFQYPRITSITPETLMAPWSNIPSHTDILVTHGPPIHHLDYNDLGCMALLQALWKIQPRLHVFGHIHAGRGVERGSWDFTQKAYENLRREKGGFGNFLVLLLGVFTNALGRLRGGTRPSTIFVNTAVVGGFWDQSRRGATVVDIE